MKWSEFLEKYVYNKEKEEDDIKKFLRRWGVSPTFIEEMTRNEFMEQYRYYIGYNYNWRDFKDVMWVIGFNIYIYKDKEIFVKDDYVVVINKK